MAKRKNVWRSLEFREKAVERMESGETNRALAQELGVHRSLLYRWRDRLAAVEPTASEEGLAKRSREGVLYRENKQLKEALARKDSGSRFFRRCLAKSRGSTPAEFWREGIYDQIREVMSMQGSLSIERMCQLAQVSRAGFYRSLAEKKPLEEEMEVRAAIQQLALEHRRRYGYRRIAATLRRQGMPINHKRVARIMREDNLLAVRSKSFVTTTDSTHQLEVYLNLAGRLQLSGINQLWVADITYIRLQREFVYLSAILDAFSRKVVGWALEGIKHFV